MLKCCQCSIAGWRLAHQRLSETSISWQSRKSSSTPVQCQTLWTGVNSACCSNPYALFDVMRSVCMHILRIARKAAQFITQPLFFTKAFSPLTLQVKYGGIKKERKKERKVAQLYIYVESMARKLWHKTIQGEKHHKQPVNIKKTALRRKIRKKQETKSLSNNSSHHIQNFDKFLFFVFLRTIVFLWPATSRLYTT